MRWLPCASRATSWSSWWPTSCGRCRSTGRCCFLCDVREGTQCARGARGELPSLEHLEHIEPLEHLEVLVPPRLRAPRVEAQSHFGEHGWSPVEEELRLRRHSRSLAKHRQPSELELKAED